MSEYPSALDVITASRGSSLPSTARLVLAHVALYASGCAGLCWVALDTLVDDTGVQRAAVRRALGQLVDAGVLVKAGLYKSRDGGHTQKYAINYAALVACRGGDLKDPPSEVGGDLKDPRGGSLRSEGGIFKIPDQIMDQIMDQIPPTPRTDRQPEASSSPIGQGMLSWLQSRLIDEHDAEEARDASSDEQQLSEREIRDIAVVVGVDVDDEGRIDEYVRDYRREQALTRKATALRPFLARVNDRDPGTLDTIATWAVAAGFIPRASGRGRVTVAEALTELARTGRLPGAALPLALRSGPGPLPLPSEAST